MISFRERNPITIGLISMLVLAVLLGVAFYFKKLPLINRNQTLKAEFADAAGLGPENEVRVAGIKIGKVTKVELLADRVLVTMEVERSVAIPRSATAQISLKTILGTKFVVIDARQDGPAFKDGDTIPLEQTSIPFEIYQAANAGVELLSQVDAEKLNEGFRALADITSDPNRNLARTASNSAKVLGPLAAEADTLKSLISKGDELLAALDESSPDIQRILSDGNTVLEVLARRHATVRSVLRNTEKLLGALGGLIKDNRSQLDSILRNLHTTLTVVDANLGELEEAFRLLGPSSESLGRILWRGRWASICVMALSANGLPSPPFPFSSVEVGTEGAAGPPVDCAPAGGSGPVPNSSAASTASGHWSRLLWPGLVQPATVATAQAKGR